MNETKKEKNLKTISTPFQCVASILLSPITVTAVGLYVSRKDLQPVQLNFGVIMSGMAE